jgi:hypothetical protein
MVYCTPRITGENKRSRSLFSYDVSVFYLEGELGAQSLTLAEGAIAFRPSDSENSTFSFFDRCWMDPPMVRTAIQCSADQKPSLQDGLALEFVRCVENPS